MIIENNSVLSIDKLHDFATEIGVKIAYESFDGRATYCPQSRRVRVSNKESEIVRMILLSHELGHAIQSPYDFKFEAHDTIESKAKFVIEMEYDAWIKGERILRKLYKNLTDEFWRIFEEYKQIGLNSYLSSGNVYLALFFYYGYQCGLYDIHGHFPQINLSEN